MGGTWGLKGCRKVAASGLSCAQAGKLQEPRIDGGMAQMVLEMVLEEDNFGKPSKAAPPPPRAGPTRQAGEIVTMAQR